MASDASRWFELFKAFGRSPSPDSYAAVFHPDGEVADAGMAVATPASQVREAIAHILKLMPDLLIDMKRYRARGDAVFVEAANSGTIEPKLRGTPSTASTSRTAWSIAAAASTTRRRCSAPCARTCPGFPTCRRHAATT